MSEEQKLQETEELSSDDREILKTMIFPVFQKNFAQDKNVVRGMVRTHIANVFPWPHVLEVLRELEEQEYIHRISTRDGGIYTAGEHFDQWSREESAPDPIAGESTVKPVSEKLTITHEQAAALIELVRQLASGGPESEVLEQVHGALNKEGKPSDKIMALLHIGS